MIASVDLIRQTSENNIICIYILQVGVIGRIILPGLYIFPAVIPGIIGWVMRI
jgi:hypothetical protein